jgi:hypothetical protein
MGSRELNSRLTEAQNQREEGPTVTNHWIKLKKMKFFPVSVVQKSVPEIRGIFIVESNLKGNGVAKLCELNLFILWYFD